MQYFPAAPWPKSLKVMSLLGTVVLLGAGYGAWRAIPPYGFAHLLGCWVACLLPAIGLVSVLFVVRGYAVDDGRLYIQRLMWATVLDMEDLIRVRHDPEAMKCSARIFGNGGLFAFTGYYQNERLGRYRLFATNPECSVVLVLRNRVVVVTPDDPEAFVRHVRTLFPQ